jgi:WD40 repeat protein
MRIAGLLASIDADGRAILWDFAARTNLATLEAATASERLHRRGINQWLAFFPDGQVLATSAAGTLKLWNNATARRLPDLVRHDRGVSAISISRDGRLFALGDATGAVELWSVEARSRLGVLEGLFGRVNQIAFSPDGQLLATAGENGTLRVWDVATQREIIRFPTQKYWIWAVRFSPDGKLLASGSGVWDQADIPGELKLWQIANGREVATLEGHTSGVYSVNFTPDGQRLVSASNDQTVRVGDIATRRELTTMASGAVKRGWGYWANLSPDGPTVLSWGAESPDDIIIWEIPTGKKLGSFVARQPVFSSDGRTLATLSSDDIQLWRIAPGKQPVPVAFPSRPTKVGEAVTSVADTVSLTFAPDGHRLVTGGKDGAVRLWSTNNHEVLTLRGHSNMVWKVAFSPDSNVLASASADRTVRLWRADDP